MQTFAPSLEVIWWPCHVTLSRTRHFAITCQPFCKTSHLTLQDGLDQACAIQFPLAYSTINLGNIQISLEFCWKSQKTNPGQLGSGASMLTTVLSSPPPSGVVPTFVQELLIVCDANFHCRCKAVDDEAILKSFLMGSKRSHILSFCATRMKKILHNFSFLRSTSMDKFSSWCGKFKAVREGSDMGLIL